MTEPYESGPHNVAITVPEHGRRGASVLIDGVEHHDGVTEYVIHHLAGEQPDLVTLGLSVLIDGPMAWSGRVRVAVMPSAANALVALGWTPPNDVDKTLSTWQYLVPKTEEATKDA